jgi:hypothetical protein
MGLPPRLVLPLVAIGCAILLAGCMMGNSVSIAGQGYAMGTKTKTLQCGTGQGHVALGVQGAGKMSVSVSDGGGATIFSDGGVGSGQNGESQPLSGKPGTWTLKVSTGFGFSGQYAISLSC